MRFQVEVVRTDGIGTLLAVDDVVYDSTEVTQTPGGVQVAKVILRPANDAEVAAHQQAADQAAAEEAAKDEDTGEVPAVEDDEEEGDENVPEATPLEDLTKAELVSLAEAEGLEFPAGFTKSEMIDAIEEHRAESGVIPSKCLLCGYRGSVHQLLVHRDTCVPCEGRVVSEWSAFGARTTSCGRAEGHRGDCVERGVFRAR